MLIIKIYYHICTYIWKFIWKFIYGKRVVLGGEQRGEGIFIL